MPKLIRRCLLFFRSMLQPVFRLIRSSVAWDRFWWVAAISGVLVIGILLSWRYWDKLADDTESLSTTVRNLGLIIGGIVAMLLAVWRSIVAERQADTAQQSLLNERFERGAEMLGSSVLSVRLGGLYALERLDAEHPEQYHLRITKLFCAFVRHPAVDRETDSSTNLTEPGTDIQAVMDAIGRRGERALKLESLENYMPDMRRVQLYRASIGTANLSKTLLSWACMKGAALEEANLSEAILNQADLTGATLGGTKLMGASLHRAILQSAVFWFLPGPLRFISYQDALSQGSVLTANLSEARLDHSDLSGASLQGSDLSGADLSDAKLSGANLSDANLSNATLVRSNLSGTILSENGNIPATGLTQHQLDQACADPENPPKLNGVVDAETGSALVWRGKPAN